MNRKPMTRALAMLASLCLLAVAVGGAMLTQALEERFGVSPLRAQPTMGDVHRFWEAQALEALSLAEEAELGRAVTEGADVPGAPNLRLRVFSVSEGEKRLIMDGADEDAWYIGQCRISFYRRTGAAASAALASTNVTLGGGTCSAWSRAATARRAEPSRSPA